MGFGRLKSNLTGQVAFLKLFGTCTPVDSRSFALEELDALHVDALQAAVAVDEDRIAAPGICIFSVMMSVA